jgi:hypothetical protein
MNPGGAVAQHVSIGGANGVERGAHALADRFVPWPLVLIDVDANSFQSCNSAICVPGRSPREMKDARLSLMARHALAPA